MSSPTSSSTSSSPESPAPESPSAEPAPESPEAPEAAPESTFESTSRLSSAMASPPPPPARRPGSLLGTAITIAALGTALTAAIFGITAGHGDAGHTGSATHAANSAGMDGMQDGSDGSDPGGGQAGQAGHGGAHAMPGMGSGGVELYAVQTGPLGVVATDGGGRLLYGSAADSTTPPTSRCTGACAQEWQPLVVPPGQQPDLEGVLPAAVGRITRPDGTSQLTLGGWPVYTNAHDEGELKTPAADADGSWFVLNPTGGKVKV